MILILKNNHWNKLSTFNQLLFTITLVSSILAVIFHIMTRGEISDPIIYKQYLVSIVLIFTTNLLLLKRKSLRVRLLSLLISFLVLVVVYFCLRGIDYCLRSYFGVL